MNSDDIRGAAMPDNSRYNLDYRPDSYWVNPGIADAISASIEDETGKRLARKLHEAGRSIGKIHPALMGGHYLPKNAVDEVEIARVTIESTSRDVVSIRAKRRGKRLTYRMMDEHGTTFLIQPTSSGRPLTMGELIQLIDTSLPEGEEERWRGQSNSYRNNALMEPDEAASIAYLDSETLKSVTEPEHLLNYVKINSSFYPELKAYYEEEAREWVHAVKVRRGGA